MMQNRFDEIFWGRTFKNTFYFTLRTLNICREHFAVTISIFPDAAGVAGAGGQTLRSQLDPSPNASRDQIRRKDPLLRQHAQK